MRKIWTKYDMNIYKIKKFTYIYPKLKLSYEPVSYENINEVLLLRENSRTTEFYKLLKEKNHLE